MYRLSLFAIAALAAIGLSTAANAACPTFHTLTNGSTADANQVMDNFNYTLGCPNFTGSIGIQTAPSGVPIDMWGNSSLSSTAISIRFLDGSANTATRNWIIGNGAGTNYGDFSFLVSSTKGGNPSGMTPVLDLATNGYVAINGGTPAARLDIVGTAATSPANIGLRFTETSTSPNARNWLIAEGNNAYGDLSFLVGSTAGGAPGGTPVMYLSKGNTVGINMNTAPTEALEVKGRIQVDTLASASSTSLCITATTNGVIATCSSSIRYKEDVRVASFGLKEVEAMRPVTFKWKGRNEQDFGFVAEEVAKIDARYVTYKDGKIEGVKYPQLTAVLAGAVKELKAANDLQAAEMARLQARNTALQAQLDQQTVGVEKVRNRLDALERRLAVRAAENQATIHQ
jgi:hypothetical protein